jgi:hypothetical protein
MVNLRSHFRIRLMSIVGAPIVRIFKPIHGVSEWDILGMEPRTFEASGGLVAARNAAERYLEKLAADIARESVRK